MLLGQCKLEKKYTNLLLENITSTCVICQMQDDHYLKLGLTEQKYKRMDVLFIFMNLLVRKMNSGF